MARTISTKLAIEGEAQYKQAVASCNSELAALKSSLALVESEFRGNANSMEALTAKGAALQTMYDKQLEKVVTLETALLNAKRAQEEYSSRVSTAQDNIQRYEQNLEKLRQSTGDTSKEQEELTQELDKWNAELAEAQAGHAAAERGVLNWQRQLNHAKIELNGLSDSLAQNDQYLHEAEASADGCAQSIDRYGKEVKEAGESAEQFAQGAEQSRQGIEQLASALAAAGIAKTVKEIADDLMACASSAAGYETALKKLSTLMVPQSMEHIKAKLTELSHETGVAAGALAEAAYQARSAGVDAANVLDFVATATKTSVAGFTDSATAVNVLTTALNAYKKDGSEAEKVASMLVKTQDEGKTSVGELAQNMGRIIPVAAAYNVSLENLTTSYALLTKSGTNTAISTTNLSAMFVELAKDGSTVADVLQEQTGRSFSELMADGQNLGGIMEILSDSVGGNATAFSNLWGSTTAGQAALSLLNSGAEEFNRTLAVMENSSGAVERNFQTMADTTEFAQQRMANAAENLRIAIGDQLNPALEKLYSTGADAFTWATDFVEENPWLVQAVAGAAGAVGLLTTGFAAYIAVTTAAKAAQDALNLSMGLCPILAITAAVGALAFAIGSWVATMDDADATTREFTDSLKESKAAYEDLTSAMGDQQADTREMADALEGLLAVEEKSAVQKSIIADLVAKLNEAVPGLGLAYDAASDSINLTTEAIDAMIERAADQEKYNAQVDRLSELYAEQAGIAARLKEAEGALTEAQANLANAQAQGREELSGYFDIAVDYNAALEDSSGGTAALENDVRALTAAQEENAAQIAELEEESNAYAEQQAEAAQKTEDVTATIERLTAEMKSLQAGYEESCKAAMESIESQLGLFNELDGTAKTTISDLISTLEGQVRYMEDYAANIQKAMEMGVDDGLIRKLSDGKEESAQILAAIVEGGADDIAALNEQFAKVDEGKESFKATIMEMEQAFDQQMEAINQDLEKLKAYEETYRIGQNNVQGLINGTASKRAELSRLYTQMGVDNLAAYKRPVDQHSPSKEFEKASRNDVQGLINGAEGRKADLNVAYEGLAQAAMEGYADGVVKEAEKIAQSFDALDAALKSYDSFFTTKSSVGDLEYQLWERTMGKAASAAEKYDRQLEALSDKLEDQKAVVREYAATYDAVVEQYGAGCAASYQYQEALRKEQLVELDILDDIEAISKAKIEAAMRVAEEYKSRFDELSDYVADKLSVRDLEYQLWSEGEGKYASEMEKHNKQLEKLNADLDDQKTKVEAADEAYRAAVEQYGEGSAEALKYEKVLRQEQVAAQKLCNSIKELTAAKQELARQDSIRQAEYRWATSGLGIASSVAEHNGSITPHEFARIAGLDVVMPDGRVFEAAYEKAVQAAKKSMAAHLPSTLEAPRTQETLLRQFEGMTAGVVNAISGMAQAGGAVRETVRVVTVDGKVLASSTFDDFVDYADANGTPIKNPKR